MAMNMAGSSGGGGRRPRRAAVIRNQRHPVGGRHAGAADHLHGGGATNDPRPIDIDLPAGPAAASRLSSNAPPLTLSVKRTGGACNSNVELYLGDTLISSADLLPKIKAIPGDPGRRPKASCFCAATRTSVTRIMMKLLG